jgi:hypothetical protein
MDEVLHVASYARVGSSRIEGVPDAASECDLHAFRRVQYPFQLLLDRSIADYGQNMQA